MLQAEQDVVGKLKSVLAPVQALQQSVQQAAATAKGRIIAARDQFLGVVQQKVAFLRVSILEQRAEDLAYLISHPPAGFSADALTRLRDKVNQSLQNRIQQASALPDAAGHQI